MSGDTFPFECHGCGALMPSNEARQKSKHAPGCPSFAPKDRRAHFTIGWNFDRSTKARVSIEIRGQSAQLVIRPFRRRMVIRADLTKLAEEIATRHVKAEVAAKRRRARR